MLKDEKLNSLPVNVNVAQFISLERYIPRIRFNRIKGYEINHSFDDIESAIKTLLKTSAYGSVNIRTFREEYSKSNPFIYKLTNIEQIKSHIYDLTEKGYYVIISETIDTHDGGVSGVIFGDTISFSPFDTCRCVEKPGTCTLPFDIGYNILKTIYDVDFSNFNARMRNKIEFSIHPNRIGFCNTKTLIWEIEELSKTEIKIAKKFNGEIRWPNNFSKMLGDKVFGLLIVNSIYNNIPHTTVINRTVKPFTFGRETGNGESWMRTCPTTPVPGKFTTIKGWIDLFILMEKESEHDQPINSIISQDHVEAEYSGATVPTKSDELLIEGVKGVGDSFMLGAQSEPLPEWVLNQITLIYHYISNKIGKVQFEWVVDTYKNIWIVQLHKPKHFSVSSRIVVEGHVDYYLNVETKDGLQNLCNVIDYIKNIPNIQIDIGADTGFDNGVFGINLIGDVSVVSHFGDVLRRGQIPSKITIS